MIPKEIGRREKSNNIEFLSISIVFNYLYKAPIYKETYVISKDFQKSCVVNLVSVFGE